MRKRFLRYVNQLVPRIYVGAIESGVLSQSLHYKRVLSLDLAALLAGTGIRGQFEEKFKALLRDIEEEAGGVICFIDELREFYRVLRFTSEVELIPKPQRVDTLLNLGKAEGSVDAGQMIKPALARGLQLVGATTRTFSFLFVYKCVFDPLLADEYRKTIAKDPALDRRFQPVTIEEPTVESTISILRGLKSRYEVCNVIDQNPDLINVYTGSSWCGNLRRGACHCGGIWGALHQ